MLKKLIYITLCFGSLSLYGSGDLKRAVDDLDVQETVKILEQASPTKNELICHIEELRAKMRSYQRSNGLKALVGFFGGMIAGGFLGQLCWKMTADPAELMNPNKGEAHKGIGIFAGMFLGLWGSTYLHNSDEQTKIRTILHLFTHKLGDKIDFFQQL